MLLLDLPSCQVGQVLDLVVQFNDQDGNPIPMGEADEIVVRLELPDGTSADVPAIPYNDGSDGLIYFHTSEDDLAQPGICKVQGFATIDGERLKTDVGLFYTKPDANTPGDVVIIAPTYMGNPSTDGTWRFRVVDDELVIERREAGVWVQKGAYLP